MIRPTRLLAAILALLAPSLVHSQTVQFGNVTVVQNDGGNNATSVTLTKGAGSSPNFSVLSGNRGDYDISFGTANDPTGGLMLSAVSQNGRDNTASGDSIGLFYATSATDFPSTTNPNKYWIPIFRAAVGDEVNINVSCAWFPYGQYLAGFARNGAGTNGGANDTLTASPGINLGTQFVDNGSGVSTVNLVSLGASSANGILLVNGAKNEDNFALSRPNADGTFTVWCHDNGVDAANYEQDHVAFVYLPVSGAGSNQLVALGRVNSNATTDVTGGTFTLTKGGTGQWYLTISGHNNTTGVLMISPEGGATNNRDNIVSYQWDAANSRWVIESRDLSGATALPTLQDGATAAEDVFSFAFFANSNQLPTVSITPPASSSVIAPATFTVEATATDSDGTIAQIEFLRNGVVVGTDNTAPYTLSESALPAGSYTYVARATDDKGGITTSAPATITAVFDPAHVPSNTALWFDGVDDYVTMGVAPELNAGGPPTNGLTLECWFRKEGSGKTSGSGSGGVTGVPLFGKGRGESDGGTQDCNYFFGISTGGLLVSDFEAYPATGITAGQNYPITASNTPITNGVWHHAAVTYDGNTATWKMYLDGAVVGTATAATGALPRYDSVQHFGIGAAFTTTGVPEGAFAGTIDEVRVWNYARSAAEIAVAKDQEIASAPGLIGRFGCNDGTGTAATDSVGSPNGTLTNGAAWVSSGATFSTTNSSPTVALTSPVDGATSYIPTPVTFEATASDPDGSIGKVQFLVNGTVVGEDTTAPYSFSWTPPAIADYVVSARAVDSLGAVALSTSATIHIVVNPNQAPTATAVSPADGATITGTSTNLQVNVADPEGDAMTVTFYGRHTTPATPGPDFSVVALPDTQYYSAGDSSHAQTVTVQQLIGTFGAQTQWILDNKITRNIAFVSHMGDIVDKADIDIQWKRATAAMAKLEHPINAMRAYGIPYGAAPGNHDEEPNGNYDSPGTTAFYNQYFGVSRFDGRDYYGGHYGTDNTNNYQLFSASGLDFIAIHMAYDTSPNQAILDWADALLKAYPHRRAIVTSHYIISEGNPGPFGTQGLAIYNNLKDNPNLFLMLCGHIHSEGRRADVFEGRTIYTSLQDYQGLANGGQGLLRIFTFSPANNRIHVESWSPTLNRPAGTVDNLPHFDGPYDLAYNMQAPISDWVPLVTVNVPAGGTSASTLWTGLEPDKTYEWYAAVTDSVNSVGSTSRRFNTAPGISPTVTLDAPATGGAYATPATINLAATANDADGSVAHVEFFADGVKIGDDSSAPYEFAWTGATPGTYTLSAVAVDDSGLASISNGVSITVTFGDVPPTVALTAPANGALYAAPANLTLAADANDTEAPVVKVEFFEGSTLLGEDNTVPFTFDVANLGAGSHSFTAKATDSAGQTTTSAAVTVNVYTEAPAPNAANASAGLFNPPSWTVVKTSPAPHQFNLPGTDVGDLELRINGGSVPFASGITLASNWDNAANGGITSDDNISQPYANASGNVFISVLDNSNNNAAGANPSTTEQTTGTGAAFLPYADGWTGASVNSVGGIISGHLPAGVGITKSTTGTYAINGLSTAGNLLAFSNGDAGTLADNVVSVRIVGGQWVVDTRDNAGGTQDNDFSFVYFPPATTGVYSGAISSAGVVSSANASLAALGATVTVAASSYQITFGDGTLINPNTAALFVVGDSTIGGSSSIAVDNLISWSANGNSFRVFSQDLPELNGAFEAIPVRFVAIPFVIDSDVDGLPDTYELAHRLDPHNPADAALDPDNDGLNTLAEYQGGTDPFVDSVAPTIGGPFSPLALQTGLDGTATLPNYIPQAATSDSNGVTSITQSPLAGGTFGIGTVTVTLTASDAAGNSASTTFDVAITDGTAPTINGTFSPLTLTTGAGGTVLLPDYAAQASAIDNVGVVGSVSQSPAAGTAQGAGSIVVTLSATDAAGNIGSRTINVGITDGTAPTIGGAFSPLTLTAGNGGVVALPDYTTQAVTGDNIAVTSVTQSPTAGSLIGAGTTHVTLTAHDAENNTAATSFDVVVTDTPGALSFATSAIAANPVNGLRQPNTIAFTINRTGGTGGDVTVEVSAKPTGTAGAMVSGFKNYAYGMDYEFATESAPGKALVSFADTQASATVSVRLKTPATTAKGRFALTLGTTTGGATTAAPTELTVTVNARDTVKPALTLKTTPPAADGKFDITGTVKDLELTSFTVKLNGTLLTPTVNPLAAFTANTAVPFSVVGATADNGGNTVVVEAGDASGNKMTATKTVNFANIRTELAGTYNALLVPVGTPDLDTVGLISLTVTNTGTFSGKITLSGVSVPVTGVVGNAGAARFKPSFGPSFDLIDRTEFESHLGVLTFTVNGADGLNGSLATSATGGTTLATFAGQKAPYTAANHVPGDLLNQPTKGVYSLAFPSKSQSPALATNRYPQGDGYAALVLKDSGSISLAGSIADGTKYSVATRLRADGSAPLFVQLYRKLGGMSGEIAFTPTTDTDVNGSDFLWLRPAQPRARFYPLGWPNGIKVNAIGTKHASPTSLDFGQLAANPLTGNANLVFTGGDLLGGSLTKAISINPGPIAAGQVKLIPPGTKDYKFSLAAGTGVFSGTVQHTDTTMVPFRGILLNKGTTNRGGFGYFLSNPPPHYGGLGESGRVFIDPAGP
jgi:hypothetical protein